MAQNPFPSPGRSPGVTANGNGTVGSVPLRPVPRHGAVAAPVSQHHDPQHPGWDLRWRRSPQVGATQTSASGTDSNQTNGNRLNSSLSGSTQAGTRPSDGLRVASESPELRDVSSREVEPAAWLGSPRRSDPFDSPNGVRLSRAQADSTQDGFVPDFFDAPFGDDSAAPARSATVENDDAFVLPPPAEQELVPPAPNQLDTDNQLRGPIEFEQRSTTAEPRAAQTPPISPETESSPKTTAPVPQAATPAPQAVTPVPQAVKPAPQAVTPAPQAVTPAPRKAESGPSLGEMLRDSTPNANQDRSGSIQELPAPAPRAPQLSPAPQQPFSNPFDARRSSDADRLDRDRLNQDRVIEGDYRPDGTLYGGGTDFLNPKAFTCDDFRKRIEEQTIDKVSLDVSPPFRPDEFNMADYERLKAKFDEKQVIRNWVSFDGRELAKGRLRDLAYEDAIIETEDGTIKQLPVNRLSEGDIAYITENWGLPRECLLDQAPYVPRTWVATTMTWKASNLCHSPLYFEDVNLERYGHTRGPLLEPLVQSAHFFANIAVLPYKMGVHAPHECQYALGYYRPGDCAPWITPPVPISARGAIAQAATMTGLFWLIP